MKGKPLNKEMVEQVLSLCRSLTGKSNIVYCTVSRQVFLDGININVREISPQSKKFKKFSQSQYGGRRGGRSEKAKVSGYLSAADLHAGAVWSVDTPASKEADEKKPAKDMTEADELLADTMDELEEQIDEHNAESQKEFWEKVEEFCRGKDNVCRAATIQFHGTPVLKQAASTEAAGVIRVGE
ncbi:hypothetical protein ACFLQR_01770 [Verrucomicrobiota bacterium]